MPREGCIDTVSLPVELLQFQAILQLFPSLFPHFLQLFVLLGKSLHGLVDISAPVVTGLLLHYSAPKLFQLQKPSQSQKEKRDLSARGNMNSLPSQLFALLAVSMHKFPSLPATFFLQVMHCKVQLFYSQGYMLEALGEISPSELKAHISRLSC